MGISIFGSPPKPYGFADWQEWAAQLADYLELQGSTLADLSLTGLAAVPTVLGFQQITGLSTATALTVPAGTVMAFIQTELQQVRWLDTGTDPTATVGFLLDTIDILPYGGNLSALRLIEVAPSAVVNIIYRR